MATSGDPGRLSARPDLGPLLTELQSVGVRVEDGAIDGQRRSGGAGPSDAGMIWVEGIAVTFPFSADYVTASPFVLRPEGSDGWALWRGGDRLGRATIPPRPRFYDLETADGEPYWKLALLHLDSLASTVIQTCSYWDTPDQCRFCAIEVSLKAGRTVAVKRPEQLAEVARAAKELDGCVDVTLTTGSTRARDRGALYVGRCARAIKDATGLPVQAQFEPPEDLSVMDRLRDMGVDTVGIHVETFDDAVFAHVAPAKARTGVEGYFRAWERAVQVFGRGQVSTYVILGMGEDFDVTVERIKRAVDLGVYPFVVPLRPVPGSLMEDLLPPPPAYVESMYRQVVPHMLARGLTASVVRAGCARCNACSAMGAFEKALSDIPSGRRLPVL
jgi:radical SAM protein (TIGR04043 family)